MMRVRSLYHYFQLAVAALMLPILAGCSDTASQRVDAARARNDGPPIWVVTDTDSTLYLFGTVHLLPDDLSWRKDDMRAAFDAAGTVFFEADTGADAQIDATVATTRLGLRRDGLRLSDGLDSYQLKLLDAAAHNGGIAVATLDVMQPWLAGEYLTLTAAKLAGLSAELSADEALKSRTNRAGKHVRYFETLEDQITLSAGLDETIQNDMLVETLENFNSLGEDMTQIARQWSVGGVEYLEAQLIKPMRVRAPEAYQALLQNRNEKWADDLAKFMDGDGTAFVAVGVSHLLGEESLQKALRAKGYRVQRYLSYQGEDVIKPVDANILRPQ